MKQAQRKAIRKTMSERDLELRATLWPELDTRLLWNRTEAVGFATMPRTMPLIGLIMDDLAGKGHPVSSVYMGLWCRVFDVGVIKISNPRELAYEAGFLSSRNESTWRSRMNILRDLHFIDIKGGASGPYSFALIYDPYYVIQTYHMGNFRSEMLNALVARCHEIGVKFPN